MNYFDVGVVGGRMSSSLEKKVVLFLFLLWSSINITIGVSAWVEIDQKYPLGMCLLWKCKGAVASNSCANFMGSPVKMSGPSFPKYYDSRLLGNFILFLCE